VLAKIGNNVRILIFDTGRFNDTPSRLEPPRPLVVRFGAMGDTVILLTLIRMLHQRLGTL
jgi:hypothetical protein